MWIGREILLARQLFVTFDVHCKAIAALFFIPHHLPIEDIDTLTYLQSVVCKHRHVTYTYQMSVGRKHFEFSGYAYVVITRGIDLRCVHFAGCPASGETKLEMEKYIGW